ncbi:MAG: RNA-binding protein 28-related protein [Amphiamblys sp. WSBS2006]|nr:MAG: RNA-binding protein 28-related protein [Amphiamblys sp. WSBS2006]
MSQTETERTVFVQNISAETTEKSLRKCFSRFGKVLSASLCRKKAPTKTTATGFVVFEDAEDAKKCLSKQPSKKTALVDENSAVTLDGKELFVLPAFSKEETKKQNSRNLHLLEVGTVFSGSAAEEKTPEDVLKLRRKIEDNKRKKIKNTSVYVSETRLSVHNIPYSVDEKELKKVFQKAGENKPKQVKVVRRDEDKKRPHCGFGFVEFLKHDSALRALKKLNNNPDVLQSKTRLVVGFALENKVAVKERQTRLSGMKQGAETNTGHGDVKHRK